MNRKEWIHFGIIPTRLRHITFITLYLFAIPGSVNSEENLLINEEPSLSMFFPTAADYYPITSKSLIVGEKCVEDSRLLVKALLNQEEWALSSIIYLPFKY